MEDMNIFFSRFDRRDVTHERRDAVDQPQFKPDDHDLCESTPGDVSRVLRRKGGFTLFNAVASNGAIEKGQGRTMLLATWLHATPLACFHYSTCLQRRDINLSPTHRVAPLLHSNGSVVSVGEYFGIHLCKTRIPFVRPE